MMKDMDVKYASDADVDFIRAMGSASKARQLWRRWNSNMDVIRAQQKEIAQ